MEACPTLLIIAAPASHSDRPSPAGPPEPDDAVDEVELDPFAEDDALAAMSPEDFYRQLRAQVEKVKSGELPGGVEDVHPVPKQRPRPKRYKRRDKYGQAF